jgi:hypothetical protein
VLPLSPLFRPNLCLPSLAANSLTPTTRTRTRTRRRIASHSTRIMSCQYPTCRRYRSLSCFLIRLSFTHVFPPAYYFLQLLVLPFAPLVNPPPRHRRVSLPIPLSARPWARNVPPSPPTPNNNNHLPPPYPCLRMADICTSINKE